MTNDVKDLYDADPDLVQRKVVAQAANLEVSLKVLLERLRINVPVFVDQFASQLGINLSP